MDKGDKHVYGYNNKSEKGMTPAERDFRVKMVEVKKTTFDKKSQELKDKLRVFYEKEFKPIADAYELAIDRAKRIKSERDAGTITNGRYEHHKNLFEHYSQNYHEEYEEVSTVRLYNARRLNIWSELETHNQRIRAHNTELQNRFTESHEKYEVEQCDYESKLPPEILPLRSLDETLQALENPRSPLNQLLRDLDSLSRLQQSAASNELQNFLGIDESDAFFLEQELRNRNADQD